MLPEISYPIELHTKVLCNIRPGYMFRSGLFGVWSITGATNSSALLASDIAASTRVSQGGNTKPWASLSKKKKKSRADTGSSPRSHGCY